jgi:hypothetical protein
MKRSSVIGVAGILAVLAMWVGCSLGYHRGMQDERRAWEATRVMALYKEDAPLPDRGKLTILGPTDKVMLDRHDHLRFYYTNPRSGIIGYAAYRRTENRPDPRTTLVK